ncbi:zinc-binding dehydrogenase [Pseudonocardia alni]|uniref:zinc-dependent alcohol dehydrogenase n=1 Tax=Pseudonocardia alni TaxID=33907 RepID=UPI0033E792A0
MTAPTGDAAGLPDTMRRVFVRAADDVAVESVPRPEPGPGELLLRTTVVGICGSDTHAAHGRHPFIALPYAPGHEVVGRVAAVGAGVTGPAPGDRVVVEPNLACGSCRPCREGRYNICERLEVFGCQTEGGLADFCVVPADRVHLLPDGLDDDTAALIEPFATPIRAVRGAGDLTGGTVVVLGAGPIGLLVAAAARQAGAARVVVTDVLESKRERAVKLGATAALDARAPDLVEQALAALGGPADAVFDCVSRESSMASAIDLVRKGGTVVVLGVAAGPVPVRLDLIQDREIVVRGSLMFVGDDFRTAIDYLSRGVVTPADLVTAVVGLDEAQRAYTLSDDPEHVKVLVRVAAG